MPNAKGVPQPDDIVVATPDGSLYWIKKSVWTGTTLPGEQSGQMTDLVSQGVILANVPLNSQPGTGCACYLLNLASIAAKADAQKKVKGKRKPK